MKIVRLFNGFILMILAFFGSSCNMVTGISNAGMGWGLFIVLALLVILIGIVVKVRRK